jgi:hypothetical protein
MTESQWKQCQDTAKMLKFLLAKRIAPDRKSRLLCTACLRQGWGELPSDPHRKAVELGERYADGLAGIDELHPIKQALQQQRELAIGEADFEQAVLHLCCETTVSEKVWSSPLSGARVLRLWTSVSSVQLGCNLIRDIFGFLPFRGVSIDSTWLAYERGLVKRLATSAYEARSLPDGTLDNTRLAVLADALEDSGCQDQDILRHCRESAVHVRGCWVLDFLLGKG